MEKVSFELCSFKSEKVASDWKRIYEENGELPFFASYDFNLQFAKAFKKNPHRKSMKLLLVRAFDEKGDTVMYLPLCKDRGEYYFMWDYSSVMYCTPIYRKGAGAEDFDMVLNKLSDILGSETLFLTKMNDMSEFTQYMRGRHTPYRKRTCVSLELGDDFYKFYLGMSDEAKEAIEHGRNAVHERKGSFTTFFYCNRPISEELFKKLYTIYYGSHPTFLQKIKNRIYDKGNPLSCALRKGDESMIAVSCIDGEPVAFLGGFVRNGCYTVVRSGESRRYGYCNTYDILLCDTIKYCIEKKGITTIDFGKGREEYKFALGGKAHYLYNFELKL